MGVAWTLRNLRASEGTCEGKGRTKTAVPSEDPLILDIDDAVTFESFDIELLVNLSSANEGEDLIEGAN